MKTFHKTLKTLSIFILFLCLTQLSFGAGAPTNATIKAWVEQAFIEDARTSSSSINVAVDNGTVTLTGTVNDLAAENYAKTEAKKINGVKAVVNELTVNTPSRPDLDIVLNIRRRLISSPAIHTHFLDVTSSGGVVTLAGTCASWAETQEAVLLASETVGVKKVINKMKIDYKTTRPDKEIKEDIQSRISRDAYLVELPIKVSVRNGTAILTGSVGNAYQADRAAEDAYAIDNVIAVDNKLTVDWIWNEGVKNKIVKPTDNALAIAVEETLDEDLDLGAPYAVNVKAAEGHVILTGAVPSYNLKKLAEKDASEVAGVIWVTNQIKTEPLYRDDYSVMEDVDFSIKTDNSLARDHIDLNVNNGVVTLTGNVNTFFEKAEAAIDAEHVLGVADVVNNIKVNWEKRFNDNSIRYRVIGRLNSNWETSPVADKINVSVKNGKVTLAGEVYTWAEYKEAARVAFLTDGVWSVTNALTIETVDYPWKEWEYSGPDMYMMNIDPYYESYYLYYYPFYNLLY